MTIAQGDRLRGAHWNATVRHTGVASGVSLLTHTHYQVIFERLSVAKSSLYLSSFFKSNFCCVKGLLSERITTLGAPPIHLRLLIQPL